MVDCGQLFDDIKFMVDRNADGNRLLVFCNISEIFDVTQVLF